MILQTSANLDNRIESLTLRAYNYPTEIKNLDNRIESVKEKADYHVYKLGENLDNRIERLNLKVYVLTPLTVTRI